MGCKYGSIRGDSKILDRVEEIEAYLATTERETFTAYEVEKMVKHIRDGGGWL